MNLIKYYINNVLFHDLDIYVKSSEGLTDLPSLKDVQKTDWPDEHGETVDLATRIYSARNITLSCNMFCSGYEDFLTKSNKLNTLLSTPNLLQLRVELPNPDDADNPFTLVYMVYIKNSLNYKKKWNEGKFVPEFSLEFVEPEPMKMVFKTYKLNMLNYIYIIGLKVNKNIIVNSYIDYDFYINGEKKTFIKSIKDIPLSTSDVYPELSDHFIGVRPYFIVITGNVGFDKENIEVLSTYMCTKIFQGI